MPVDIICPIHLTLAKKKSMSLAKSFQQELADGNICAIVILLLIFFFLQKHIYDKKLCRHHNFNAIVSIV